jgi:hypothetical protein
MIPGPGLLLAGVAAAALMGVGLGLWARPAMNERRLSVAAFEAPIAAPARVLQIVVGEAPAPLGAPIEVLPGSRAAPPPAPQRIAPEPLAPVRPAVGLVRVQAVEPAPEPVDVAPPPRPKPKPTTLRAAVLRVQAVEPAPEPADVAPPPKPRPKPAARPAPVKSAKVNAAAPPKAAPRPVPATKVKVKDVENAKHGEKSKPAKATAAKAVQNPAPPKVRLTKADAREKAPHIQMTTERKPAKSVGPVHAVAHTPPRKVEPPTKMQKVALERAAAKPVKKVKPAPAAKRAEKVAITAKPPAKAPPKAIRPARGAGPLRVAKAAPRPDPAISDVDRQMYLAYSSARAAGVPDWQLRRQQQRWEQARAAAAREAPWAVHDVYLARIAELHDLTRDAEGPED